MVKLRLSRNSPIKTTVTDSDGRLLYVISTPHCWNRRTTTISRPSETSGQTASYDVEEIESELAAASSGNIEELARIHWHHFRSSILVYQGQIQDFGDLMQSRGILKRTRILQGPDGQSYRWKMGWVSCRLEFNDSSKKPEVVAQFHRYKYIFNKKQAELEVEDSVKNILDWVVITWIFIERRRRDMEHKTLSA